MKPYGYYAVGSYSFGWSAPGKPHTVTTAGDAEISKRADLRRPKRSERQRAKWEIQQQLEEAKGT